MGLPGSLTSLSPKESVRGTISEVFVQGTEESSIFATSHVSDVIQYNLQD